MTDVIMCWLVKPKRAQETYRNATLFSWEWSWASVPTGRLNLLQFHHIQIAKTEWQTSCLFSSLLSSFRKNKSRLTRPPCCSRMPWLPEQIFMNLVCTSQTAPDPISTAYFLNRYVCVHACSTTSPLDNGSATNTCKNTIVGGVFLYAVRVVWKENKPLFFTRSCFSILA